jgi:cell division septation protein DedD
MISAARAFPLLRVFPVLLACALLAPPALSAQDGSLDRVQNLMATGRFTEARNTLEQWERTYADPRSSAAPADRARALFLRGALSPEAKEAEDAFVAVILSYPSSDVAPEALLRLGQALLTGGEARRAVAYLERLRNDYPGAAQRETGWLWLARAQLAAGSPAAACTTARQGVGAASSANLRTLIEIEQDRACGAGAQRNVAATPRPAPPPAESRAAPPATTPPATTPPATTPPATTPPATTPPATTPPAAAPPAAERSSATAPRGNFAVQTGAYREASSARTIADQMRAKGFDVRVVLVGDSPLHRVRFGAFASNAEAAAASRAVQAAGFATIIVNDVRLER